MTPARHFEAILAASLGASSVAERTEAEYWIETLGVLVVLSVRARMAVAEPLGLRIVDAATDRVLFDDDAPQTRDVDLLVTRPVDMTPDKVAVVARAAQSAAIVRLEQGEGQVVQPKLRTAALSYVMLLSAELRRRKIVVVDERARRRWSLMDAVVDDVLLLILSELLASDAPDVTSFVMFSWTCTAARRVALSHQWVRARLESPHAARKRQILAAEFRRCAEAEAILAEALTNPSPGPNGLVWVTPAQQGRLEATRIVHVLRTHADVQRAMRGEAVTMDPETALRDVVEYRRALMDSYARKALLALLYWAVRNALPVDAGDMIVQLLLDADAGDGDSLMPQLVEAVASGKADRMLWHSDGDDHHPYYYAFRARRRFSEDVYKRFARGVGRRVSELVLARWWKGLSEDLLEFPNEAELELYLEKLPHEAVLRMFDKPLVDDTDRFVEHLLWYAARSNSGQVAVRRILRILVAHGVLGPEPLKNRGWTHLYMWCRTRAMMDFLYKQLDLPLYYPYMQAYAEFDVPNELTVLDATDHVPMLVPLCSPPETHDYFSVMDQLWDFFLAKGITFTDAGAFPRLAIDTCVWYWRNSDVALWHTVAARCLSILFQHGVLLEAQGPIVGLTFPDEWEPGLAGRRLLWILLTRRFQALCVHALDLLTDHYDIRPGADLFMTAVRQGAPDVMRWMQRRHSFLLDAEKRRTLQALHAAHPLPPESRAVLLERFAYDPERLPATPDPQTSLLVQLVRALASQVPAVSDEAAMAALDALYVAVAEVLSPLRAYGESPQGVAERDALRAPRLGAEDLRAALYAAWDALPKGSVAAKRLRQDAAAVLEQYWGVDVLFQERKRAAAALPMTRPVRDDAARARRQRQLEYDALLRPPPLPENDTEAMDAIEMDNSDNESDSDTWSR